MGKGNKQVIVVSWVGETVIMLSQQLQVIDAAGRFGHDPVYMNACNEQKMKWRCRGVLVVI